MPIMFEARRGYYSDVSEETFAPVSSPEREQWEEFDGYYRAVCAMLYNYAPTSGHPGGSISAGRFSQAIAFDSAVYDLREPNRLDSDIISYAAGHKALGLYALWALRNEIARIAAPELLPRDERDQLRLEDLLGFRRNPSAVTPLIAQFRSKALDGHPTPATPFVRLSTGASGVGIGSSLGLALAAVDCQGDSAPRVHIIDGEGGLTPGRVAEALAFAGTAGLWNAVVHVDWNQASIDSNNVTREGDKPGDYVQWNPMELFHLHDWNVIYVPNGFDFQQIITAQRFAAERRNGQPTAIVYRTTKGWEYGIEGRASHGAGHKLCSSGFYAAVAPLLDGAATQLPRCGAIQVCDNGRDRAKLESCFWEALALVRQQLERDTALTSFFAARLHDARNRVWRRSSRAQSKAVSLENVYARAASGETPQQVALTPGTSTTLRGQLGRVLGFFNDISRGAFFVAAADLLSSTSVNESAKNFEEGFFRTDWNRGSRTLAIGGICEDAIAAVLSGVSSFGQHIGVGSSYGAFMAPLGHIAARLYAIGSQAKRSTQGSAYNPMILVCAHAGMKTGEDGPTHADPQALQLLQENFPDALSITLTPWEPQEIYPLLCSALTQRPALIFPFVTRPAEPVVDRELLGLAPASAAAAGVYRLRAASEANDGTIVLQESGVTYEFVMETLPQLVSAGVDVDVYYVASAELFDALPQEERDEIFPEEKALDAMGITGFTKSTMYRWIRSDFGRAHTLHPFMRGHFLGSGQAADVVREAGLDGASQFEAVMRYIEQRRARKLQPKESMQQM